MELLDYFYRNSALTFEGCEKSEENIEFINQWLTQLGANKSDEIKLHWISGKTMNDNYGLSGHNAYPYDLTLLVIEPEDIDLMKVVIERFTIGGRWFDDIVDNNAFRNVKGR
jgi:hypothetical protein